MTRILSIWLPHLAIENFKRIQNTQSERTPKNEGASCNSPSKDAPFVLTVSHQGALRISAMNARAAAQGLRVGGALTGARAMIPSLAASPADLKADARTLRRLADWCVRYSPWTATDGQDGLWLNVTGCAHLFGGEQDMARDIVDRLAAMGFSARIGLADTPGAAWGAARFATEEAAPIQRIAQNGTREALAPLPVEALRLSPAHAILLRRLGLKTVGEAALIPRASLARRFSGDEDAPGVLERLDQAFGEVDEPLSPLRAAAPRRAGATFAEPLIAHDRLTLEFEALLAKLCADLAAAYEGARALTLACCHVDGRVRRIAVRLGRPNRAPAHIGRLFQDKLLEIDLGFGVDALVLSADKIDELKERQLSLSRADDAEAVHTQAKSAALCDRLSNRLSQPPARLAPRESHIPERAQSLRPAAAPALSWTLSPPPKPPRPSLLLPRPEPISVLAEIPEGPPIRFTWRRAARRTLRAEGPERIAPEWRAHVGEAGRVRDYYRVEDSEGRRYWLFREGFYHPKDSYGDPEWFVHGVFE